MTSPSSGVKTLVYDTETTGLCVGGADYRHPGQPGLVQLGAILYVGERPIQEINFLVKSFDIEGNRIVVPRGASEIHGFSDEDVESHGMLPGPALSAFDRLVRMADRVAAFNAPFDDMIVAAAVYRSGHVLYSNALGRKPHICVQRSAASAIRWTGHLSLKRAYARLVDGLGFDDAHNAMADVRATAKVLFLLEQSGRTLVRTRSVMVPDSAE